MTVKSLGRESVREQERGLQQQSLAWLAAFECGWNGVRGSGTDVTFAPPAASVCLSGRWMLPIRVIVSIPFHGNRPWRKKSAFFILELCLCHIKASGSGWLTIYFFFRRFPKKCASPPVCVSVLVFALSGRWRVLLKFGFPVSSLLLYFLNIV